MVGRCVAIDRVADVIGFERRVWRYAISSCSRPRARCVGVGIYLVGMDASTCGVPTFTNNAIAVFRGPRLDWRAIGAFCNASRSKLPPRVCFHPIAGSGDARMELAEKRGKLPFHEPATSNPSARRVAG